MSDAAATTPRSDLRSIRVMLYVPADRARMVAKAQRLDADAVILDLEDAVAPDQKDEARRAGLAAALDWPLDGPDLWIRVNACGTPEGAEDLRSLVGSGLRSVVLPKIDAMAAEALTETLGELGRTGDNLRVIGLVESARGLVDAPRLARRLPQLVGLQLGAEDFTADMDIERTAEGEEIRYARSALAVAATAQGLSAIDTPITEYRDLEVVRRDARIARRAGFTGKACIHPAQIGTVVAEFSPSAEEIDHAQRVVEAFAACRRHGHGATSVDGRMVDAPVAERAAALLARSRADTHSPQRKEAH
ncbi:HpcH/HpaI aldolase/citrate lyase family protein [Brachybacterium sacelli]|uniref:Citrate lyase subunit beta/citryl-CoA lyase n=1 Tax=Brachybacterium sacelli TaxID=173364 RepID=A0ABS4WZ92_9MICO|nr:CoA ester lyase [Brachybacterium sacelli]MBP2381530.1 citrate lyase subunit beta/citryl-CoA lyase [Brachybacterium sacelli]